MKIIRTKLYAKAAKRLGISGKEEADLLVELAMRPQRGKLIIGSGGLRKIRLALGNRGKSAGARVIYTIFEVNKELYLLWAYSKSEQENMSKAEINNLKKLVEIIREERI